MENHENQLSIQQPSSDSPVVIVDKASEVRTAKQMEDVAVFPGSFNPLHSGHIKLKQCAAAFLRREVVFEISVTNAEKAAPAAQNLVARVDQFSEHRVVLTNAPLFQEKSDLFPGCWFVVGFDTAARIVDPRFYNDSDRLLTQCLNQFEQRGHRFLVAGRLSSDGTFCGADSLVVVDRFRELFHGIPESQFREDISSTQLRRGDDS